MTRKEPIGSGKISEHGHGLGTVTREMVERRARELAIADGRTAEEVNEGDRRQARDELLGTEEAKIEPEPGVPVAGPWDPVPGSAGHRAETQEIDDEQTVAERLVEGGVSEADHDERLEAGRDKAKEEGAA